MLCISQTAYIDRMLKKFGLADAKSVRSPQMHSKPTLRVEGNPKSISDPALPFREMVGSLQFGKCSENVGRSGSAYTKENFRQAQRVMRYLRDTKHIGLVYRYADIGKYGIKLADAGHAGCPETIRSVSGWVLHVNVNLWHWQSKKQSTVADDTCGAELIAAHKCTKEIKWAQKMLLDLGIKQQPMATLYCDNQSTIKEIENNGNSQEHKHLAKKTLSIAEWMGRGRLEIQYVPTTSNIADILTKPLGPFLRDQLNLEDVRKAMVGIDESKDVAASSSMCSCDSDVIMSD
ncbi:putative transposable element [Phytophthora palmivora]|uniref:Transposable element n=1 Tax=Phytophthora palmivora TaxID=4796 RepID=A0A2P4YIQ6_9STRA|nr:putative transposable element [Phytophthora palmivora]